MTHIARRIGAVVSAGAAALADIPFPRTNLLAWVSAGNVATITETIGGNEVKSIDAFIDQQSGVSYAKGNARQTAQGLRNGVRVIDNTGYDNASTTYSGYILPATLRANKASIDIFFTVSKPAIDPGTGASANGETQVLFNCKVSGSDSAMLQVDNANSSSMRVVARHSAVAEGSSIVSLPMPEAQYFVARVTINYVGKTVRLRFYDRFRKSLGDSEPQAAFAAIAGAVNSGSPANESVGLFGRPRVTAPFTGSPWKGGFEQLIWMGTASAVGTLLTAAQEKSILRHLCRRLRFLNAA